MRLLSALTGMLLAAGASSFMTPVALRPLSELRGGRQVRTMLCRNMVTHARLLHDKYVLPGKIGCDTHVTHLIVSGSFRTNEMVVVIWTLYYNETVLWSETCIHG